MIPNAVAGAVEDGRSMLQAWREYLMLTQADMADAWVSAKLVMRRLRPSNPRKAMGITLEQLAY
jgi:hypothetical protein